MIYQRRPSCSEHDIDKTGEEKDRTSRKRLTFGGLEVATCCLVLETRTSARKRVKSGEGQGTRDVGRRDGRRRSWRGRKSHGRRCGDEDLEGGDTVELSRSHDSSRSHHTPCLARSQGALLGLLAVPEKLSLCVQGPDLQSMSRTK
jgi:hypothetical protein